MGRRLRVRVCFFRICFKNFVLILLLSWINRIHRVFGEFRYIFSFLFFLVWACCVCGLVGSLYSHKHFRMENWIGARYAVFFKLNDTRRFDSVWAAAFAEWIRKLISFFFIIDKKNKLHYASGHPQPRGPTAAHPFCRRRRQKKNAKLIFHVFHGAIFVWTRNFQINIFPVPLTCDPSHSCQPVWLRRIRHIETNS